MFIEKKVIAGLFLFIFFISVSSALNSIGVTPASIRIAHVSGETYEADYEFFFLADDSEAELEVLIEGDLAEYVQLDDSTLNIDRKVKIHLSLPANIEKPGHNFIFVHLRRK